MVLCKHCGEAKGAEYFYWKKDGTLRYALCKSCWSDRYYRPRAAERIAYVAEWKRQKFARPGVREVACEWCGTAFESSLRRALFCSRSCKNQARSAVDAAELLASKPPRRCLHCGADMPQKMRVDAVWCSEKCNSAAHNLLRKMAQRAGADRESFARVTIAERDGWRCQLCKKKVDKTKVHPDPLSPSIDHIMPLARGGTNDPANLQLVHLRCNLSKRDRPRGEQLRLIG